MRSPFPPEYKSEQHKKKYHPRCECDDCKKINKEDSESGGDL